MQKNNPPKWGGYLPDTNAYRIYIRSLFLGKLTAFIIVYLNKNQHKLLIYSKKTSIVPAKTRGGETFIKGGDKSLVSQAQHWSFGFEPDGQRYI